MVYGCYVCVYIVLKFLVSYIIVLYFDEDDGLVYFLVLSMGDMYNIDECNDLWGNVNV